MTRDELCSVPFLNARGWLCNPGSESLKPNVRAWVRDWLSRQWRTVTRRNVYPGQTVLVEAGDGGYRGDAGWDPTSTDPVEPVRMGDDRGYVTRACWTRDGGGWRPSERRVRMLPPEDHADAAEGDESLSMTGGWQTIASHGLHVGVEVERIAAVHAGLVGSPAAFRRPAWIEVEHCG